MRIASASLSPYRPPRFLAVAISVRHSSSVRYSRTRTSLLDRRRGGVSRSVSVPAVVPATTLNATFPFLVLGMSRSLPANLRGWAPRRRSTLRNLVRNGKVEKSHSCLRVDEGCGLPAPLRPAARRLIAPHFPRPWPRDRRQQPAIAARRGVGCRGGVGRLASPHLILALSRTRQA